LDFDALETIAEVATAFAGFTGLITFFHRRDRDSWRAVDRTRFWFTGSAGHRDLSVSLGTAGVRILLTGYSRLRSTQHFRVSSFARTTAVPLGMNHWMVDRVGGAIRRRVPTIRSTADDEREQVGN
jgi:hypothetical protein